MEEGLKQISDDIKQITDDMISKYHDKVYGHMCIKVGIKAANNIVDRDKDYKAELTLNIVFKVEASECADNLIHSKRMMAPLPARPA
jgi:hypothetical protein